MTACLGTSRGEADARQRHTMLAACLKRLDRGELQGTHLAEEITLTMMETGEVTRGRAAVTGLIKHLYGQAFATQTRFRSPVVEGRYAMIEAEFVGRHIGTFAGIPASQREVRVPYAVACDFDGEHVTALRVYLPLDALVRQIRRG